MAARATQRTNINERKTTMTTRPAVKLAPSMMCASFLELNKDLEALKSGGIELLHMDIMDGAYVPNFSLGADYCKAVHSECPIVQDIHLMIENVDKHLPLFCGIHLGVRVTIHPETSRHPVASLQKIRELGASPGIAIDPAQPVSLHQHLFGFVDHVCVMTVNPGYAGQKLVPGTIGKLTEAREFLDMVGKNNIFWSSKGASVNFYNQLATNNLFFITKGRLPTLPFCAIVSISS